MKKVLGIDPGIQSVGIVLVSSDRKVLRADVVKPVAGGEAGTFDRVNTMLISLVAEFGMDWLEADYVVLEGQQSYMTTTKNICPSCRTSGVKYAGRRAGDTYVNPNDLIRIAHVGGALAFYLAHNNLVPNFVLPRVWTGQKPKEPNNIQIQKVLGKAEKWPWKKPVKPIDYNHAIDAAGMALWFIDNHDLT